MYTIYKISQKCFVVGLVVTSTSLVLFFSVLSPLLTLPTLNKCKSQFEKPQQRKPFSSITTERFQSTHLQMQTQSRLSHSYAKLKNKNSPFVHTPSVSVLNSEMFIKFLHYAMFKRSQAFDVVTASFSSKCGGNLFVT